MCGRGKIRRGPRKYVKEASDNKSEENKPLLKFNFNGALFSAIFLSRGLLHLFARSATDLFMKIPHINSPALCYR